MARKSKNLPVNNDFLIFTNGKRSEKNYFEVLRGSFKSIYRIKVRFMNDAPDMLVRHAIGEKKKTNRVWCVFDKDEFTNKSICLAIKTAKENGINIAFSNMAFEVWLIDHFYQCKQEKTNEQLINDIDQLLKENGYSQGYAKNDFNLIKTMFIPRLDDAIQNADVPEFHEDGKSWHFHGLMRGIPKEMLVLFTPDMHLPYSILDKLKKGECVYDWPFYSSHFGFCNIEPVRDHDKVCGYITKYIAKDLESISRLNAHCYYASKVLKRSKIIKRGELAKDFVPDFENDYIKSKMFSSKEEALSFFENRDSDEFSGVPSLSRIEDGERKIAYEIL